MTNPPELPIPAVGETVTDPTYGRRITRLTDARARGLAWTENEYSSVACMNADDSLILLVEVDRFSLYTLKGERKPDLPIEINSSSEPRWSRTDPSTFYFVRGNALCSFSAASWRVREVRTFSEYAAISGKGESDISADGNHMVFCGDDAEVVLYALDTDTKGPVLDVRGHPVESLYLTAANEVVISWA